MLKILNKKSLFDSWGIILSLLCAVHCAALPLIALASPVASQFIEEAPIHLMLFIVLMPISFFAFVKDRKDHEKLSPLILASSGLTLLFVGLLMESDHHHHEELFAFSDGISIVGSILLIIAHGINLRHLSACKTCAHDDHSHGHAAN